jgi:hypothetical protein
MMESVKIFDAKLHRLFVILEIIILRELKFDLFFSRKKTASDLEAVCYQFILRSSQKTMEYFQFLYRN